MPHCICLPLTFAECEEIKIDKYILYFYSSVFTGYEPLQHQPQALLDDYHTDRAPYGAHARAHIELLNIVVQRERERERERERGDRLIKCLSSLTVQWVSADKESCGGPDKQQVVM